VKEFGQDLSIELKGMFSDVVGFKFNGKTYELSAPGNDTTPRIIKKDGKQIGTITKNSAVVNLPAAFTDRLQNGTHTVEVLFSDNLATNASGKANIIVNRVAVNDNNGADPAAGKPISPSTGDDSNPTLMRTLNILALIVLLGAAYVLRQRQKPTNRLYNYANNDM
jgi:hypothetical protein